MTVEENSTISLPADLVIGEFVPYKLYDTQSDTLTIQWQETSITERNAPTNPDLTFFHANRLKGEPVVGLRISGYSRFKAHTM